MLLSQNHQTRNDLPLTLGENGCTDIIHVELLQFLEWPRHVSERQDYIPIHTDLEATFSGLHRVDNNVDLGRLESAFHFQRPRLEGVSAFACFDFHDFDFGFDFGFFLG